MKPFSDSDMGYMSLNKQSKCGEPPVNAKCMAEKGILPEGVQGESHNRATTLWAQDIPLHRGSPLSPVIWSNSELWLTDHKNLPTTSSPFKKLLKLSFSCQM